MVRQDGRGVVAAVLACTSRPISLVLAAQKIYPQRLGPCVQRASHSATGPGISVHNTADRVPIDAKIWRSSCLRRETWPITARIRHALRFLSHCAHAALLLQRHNLQNVASNAALQTSSRDRQASNSNNGSQFPRIGRAADQPDRYLDPVAPEARRPPEYGEAKLPAWPPIRPAPLGTIQLA